MVDLYCAVLEESKIPDEPNENMFLGSIDLDEHKSLEDIFKTCKKSNIDLKYFNDVYIEPKEVRVMLNIFELYKVPYKSFLAKEAYEKMFIILREATKKACGILSLGHSAKSRAINPIAKSNKVFY